MSHSVFAGRWRARSDARGMGVTSSTRGSTGLVVSASTAKRVGVAACASGVEQQEHGSSLGTPFVAGCADGVAADEADEVYVSRQHEARAAPSSRRRSADRAVGVGLEARSDRGRARSASREPLVVGVAVRDELPDGAERPPPVGARHDSVDQRLQRSGAHPEPGIAATGLFGQRSIRVFEKEMPAMTTGTEEEGIECGTGVTKGNSTGVRRCDRRPRLQAAPRLSIRRRVTPTAFDWFQSGKGHDPRPGGNGTTSVFRSCCCARARAAHVDRTSHAATAAWIAMDVPNARHAAPQAYVSCSTLSSIRDSPARTAPGTSHVEARCPVERLHRVDADVDDIGHDPERPVVENLARQQELRDYAQHGREGVGIGERRVGQRCITVPRTAVPPVTPGPSRHLQPRAQPRHRPRATARARRRPRVHWYQP